MSILGTIFGIGEFEGERNQSLRGSTGKQHAYDLALLDVRISVYPSLLIPWRASSYGFGLTLFVAVVPWVVPQLMDAVRRDELAPQAHAAPGPCSVD